MVRVTFSFLEKERNQKLNTPTQRLFFCQFIFRTSVFLTLLRNLDHKLCHQQVESLEFIKVRGHPPRKKKDEERPLPGAIIIAVLLSFT